MRGSPKFIIQKYQHDIGFPSLPPYYALGIFTGSQTSKEWANSTIISQKIDKYADALPIEGILIDQFMRSTCAFEKDPNFNYTNLYNHLKSKNM